MTSGPTLLALAASCALSIFSTFFSPEYRIVAFAPFIAITLNRSSLIKMLWWAIFSGLISDLASVHYRFGISSVCFVIISLLLFPFRRQFYEDKPLPFLVLTYLISSLTTLLLAFVSIYKGTIHFSGLFPFLKEVFISSLFDIFVSLLFVFVPVKVYSRIRERGFKQLLKRKEEA